ncbi:hypothetical protein Rpal_0689 [Rhodopseudomonas palustris TIE-1]|uniref:phage major tropism determinant n=1 Tax=Rhodopseudomonas palustris TaxID=1076 RepID=UPI000164AB6D|nr:hypothetical protein [Rhodopseudomonas palustris]ACE99248.1 hypothetical protein Rpal_0689 [Rhodopseudomonas palustris TIE-1]
MARKFETDYRVAKTSEVLPTENKFRFDVDLRLDALELALKALGSGADTLVARVLRVIEQEIAPRAAEIDVLLTDYREGVPAAVVAEEADGRQFLTPARRASILSDLRGGADDAHDTLAKLAALIAALDAAKATPADITTAVNALKGAAPAAYDTLVEIATKLTEDDSVIAGLLTNVGNRLRLDANEIYSAAQKAQGLANLGIADLPSGTFVKADRSSVAFVKTGAGSVSLKAGTLIGLSGALYSFASATAVQMPTLAAGTDYAIYLCNDGTLRADASFTAATGFTAAQCRQIGGFHYAPGGNAAARAGGDATPAINAYSLWDLKFRPSCWDPRGMTLVAGAFWCDIYLTGVDHHINGTSKYNVTIADGSSPPKIPAALGGNGTSTFSTFTWYEANEVMRDHGKDLLSYGEFAVAAFGATEATQSGADPVSTILRQAFTSKWGVMLATGNMWVWGHDFGGADAGAVWSTSPGRGQANQQPCAVVFGGGWESGACCGSRASSWDAPPWISYGNFGARGRCDHLAHL